MFSTHNIRKIASQIQGVLNLGFGTWRLKAYGLIKPRVLELLNHYQIAVIPLGTSPSTPL